MEAVILSKTTSHAVDLETVKSHLRLEIGETDEDNLLNGLIDVAEGRVEEITNIKLTNQRIGVYFDEWPSECLNLPYGPVSTGTTGPTLTYKDSDSSTITVGSSVYIMDSKSFQPRLCVEYDESWPTATLHNVNPILLSYQAGYMGSTEVPERFKLAVKLLIGHWYENRENTMAIHQLNEIPEGVMNLLRSSRLNKF